MFKYELKIERTEYLPEIQTLKQIKDYCVSKELKDSPFENSLVIAVVNGKPTGWTILARGDNNSVTGNLKGLIAFVGLTQCNEVILMHNHPFVSNEPSTGDIEQYYKVKRVLETVGVELREMLIVFEGKRKNILDFIERPEFKKEFDVAREKYWWKF